MALSSELEKYDQKLREYEELVYGLRKDLHHLTKTSIHDPKTNLYSSSFLYTRLRDEVVRSERYRHFLSLILIHIEPESASSTDQVDAEIRRFGDAVSGSLNRQTDVVAHFSRRQVAVLLPETDRDGAQIIVDRYKATLPAGNRQFRYGILSFPEDATNIESLLATLDGLSEDLFRGAAKELRQSSSYPAN